MTSPIAPPPLPPLPPNRRSKGWGGCLLALGGMMLIAALAGLALFRGERETAPVAWPAPQMPPVVVEHPSKARLEAPQGAFAENARLSITARDQVPSAEPFQREGPAFEINGYTLLSGQRPAAVDLPEGAAGDRAVVLFHSLGAWIRIPSHPVRLADGSPGRRAQLDGVHFPWILTVARAPDAAPAADLAEGPGRAAALARLEQLRITDRAAFLAELDRFNAMEQAEFRRTPSAGAPFSLVPSAHAASPSTTIAHPFAYGTDHLEKARIAALRAYGLIYHLDAGQAEARRSSAVKLYRDALHHLWEARRAVFAMSESDRAYQILDESNEQNLTYIYGGTLPLSQMVEVYCGTLAPWGLQFMRHLVADDDVHDRGFDVRAIPFFDQLPFVDVALPGGRKPVPLLRKDGQPSGKIHIELEHWQRQLVQELNILPDQALHFDIVRLYSPTVEDWNANDILSALKTGKSGVSALFAAALLYKGAAVGASVWAVYEIAAPFLEYWMVDPMVKEASREAARQKRGPTHLTLINLYDGAKLLGQRLLDSTASPLGGLTDIVFNCLIDFGEMERFERLRAETKAASSGVEGYRNWGGWWTTHFPLPPVVLMSTVQGPTKDRPNFENLWGSYLVEGRGTLSMALNHSALSPLRRGPYSLAECFRQQTDEWNLPLDDQLRAATPYGIHWKPVSPENWMRIWVDQAPDLQVVEWSLEEEALLPWARAAGLSLEKWMDAASVEVCYGTEWNDRYRLRPDPAGGTRRGHPLRAHLRPGGERRHRTFGLAILSPPIRGRPMPAMVPDDVGQWHAHPAYRMDLKAAKQYRIRLRYGETVLMDFPVGFHDRTIGAPTTGYQVPSSQFTIEVATVSPPRDPRPDIMEFLLPRGMLPSRLDEQSRTNLSEIGGPFPLDVAEQTIITSGFQLRQPPVTYDDNPLLPPMNADADMEAWQQRVDQASKNRKPDPPRARVTVRIGRPGKPGPLSEAMLRAGLELIARDETLQETSPGVLESGDTASRHAVVFRQGDLLIGLFGDDNSALTRQYVASLRPLLAKRAETVSAKAAPAP